MAPFKDTHFVASPTLTASLCLALRLYLSITQTNMRISSLKRGKKQQQQFAIWELSEDTEPTELRSASRISPLFTDFIPR